MIQGKVSIVIACHNYGRYVGEAIGSALVQTYRNSEVIVLDDGSTDNTPEVLAKYALRATIVRHDNVGVAVTRNRGIAMSDAEFILPLDADDRLDPRYLEKTVPLMMDSTVGIVTTPFRQFGTVTGVVASKAPTVQEIARANTMPITSLIRRKAFDETNGYTRAFVEAVNNNQQLAFEDWNLWIDIIKRGWKVKLLDEPLFHYRRKAGDDIEWRNSQQTLDAQGDVGAWCVGVIRKLHPELYK
jgi:glycosyltransferase involved in cell wall biosynthesis